MFNARFDDLKRKMLKHEKPVLLHELATAQIGTERFEEWFRLYDLDGSKVHVEVGDDMKTYTFFTIITDPKVIVRELERKQLENVGE